jgi:uncharacterized protein YjbJ (UPF0337 family)
MPLASPPDLAALEPSIKTGRTTALRWGCRTKTQNIRSEVIVAKREFIGNWTITFNKLKRRWTKLTQDNLRHTGGNLDDLIGQIQEHTGETRETVEKAIHEFLSDTRCR